MSSELLLIHTPVKHRLLREDFPDGLLVQPSLARALSVLVPCAGMTPTRLGSPLLTGLCNGESTGPSLPLGFEPLGVVRKVHPCPNLFTAVARIRRALCVDRALLPVPTTSPGVATRARDRDY